MNGQEFAVVGIFKDVDRDFDLDALREDPRPGWEIVEDEFYKWDLADALEKGWPCDPNDGSELSLCGYYNYNRCLPPHALGNSGACTERITRSNEPTAKYHDGHESEQRKTFVIW